MRITRRQAKSLTRDRETYRDDRIFWIGTDDRYAPKQYLEFFQVSRVRIFLLGAGDQAQAAERVVERLRDAPEAQEGDEKWALLDADHYVEGSHLTSFLKALQMARDAGIQVAISKPSFEFWLLLHWVEAAAASGVRNAREAEELLRRTVGEYNKTKLKKEHYPMERVVEAARRAKLLDEEVGGGLIPSGNTTRMYQLIGAMARSGNELELSEEWRALRDC